MSYKKAFKYPFFVSPHAVGRFRERVDSIPPAEVIDLIQAKMQDPGLPVTLEYRDSQLSPIFRFAYRNGRGLKSFYVPVAKGDEGWPVIPTIYSEESHIHWKLRRGKLDCLFKKEACQ